MKKKSITLTLAALLSISLIGGILTGCSTKQASASTGTSTENSQQADGGVLTLKVNPEIDISYDDEGLVTKVEGKNDDGNTIVAEYADYSGKDCRQVVSDLVAKINEAGYFVEETDGSAREITLEIEAGSVLPEENFLKNIVAGIQEYTSAQNLTSPVNVNGESNYGWSDYGDTDYGPDNDGVTDYNDTDYGPNNDGVTDYTPPSTSTPPADTDYGPGSDGVTDYTEGNTDYDPGNGTDDDSDGDGDSGYDDGHDNDDDDDSNDDDDSDDDDED